MNQLNMFDPLPDIHPVDAKDMTLEQQFELFHRLNPQVYERLHDIALQLRRRGRQKIGMKMLFEVLRWQHAMTTTDPASEFKLNNNYTAFYARLLMERDQRLAGMFETRAQRHHANMIQA